MEQIVSPLSGVEARVLEVRQRLARACQRAGRRPEEVTLVAVTKGVAAELIEAAFRAGLRHFGENRVQEAEAKMSRLEHLPLTWHLVGPLQTNKVNKALRLFHLIHSVDSVRLARALSQRAPQEVALLLQVNIAMEATKQGFSPQELPSAREAIARMPHLQVRGLMAIPPQVQDAEEVRPFFRRLRELRDSLGLEQLSMGMSDDFEVGVEEGATLVRIGRAIFGPRPAG